MKLQIFLYANCLFFTSVIDHMTFITLLRTFLVFINMVCFPLTTAGKPESFILSHGDWRNFFQSDFFSAQFFFPFFFIQ